ncbi:MAG: hypothetical protein QW786_00465 [Candidatus Hadarchaeum sp.]
MVNVNDFFKKYLGQSNGDYEDAVIGATMAVYSEFTPKPYFFLQPHLKMIDYLFIQKETISGW